MSDESGHGVFDRGGFRPLVPGLQQQQWDSSARMAGVGSTSDNRQPLSAREHLLAVAIYAGVLGLLGLGYIVPSVTRLSVPSWLGVVGLWSTYVVTGSVAGSILAWLSAKLTPSAPAQGTPSLTRRCVLLVTGMIACALVTWLMEVQIGAMTATARAALRAPADLPRALAFLVIVQLPGLVVLLGAIMVGFRYRRAAGLAKGAVLAALLVASSQSVILSLAIVRATLR